MEQTEILARLIPILEDTFPDAEQEITLSTTQDEIEEWDSLAQVRLFLAIETDFGFRFDLDEMENIAGVADLVQVISQKVT
ncbi:MAG: acyl carrier protein [Pseudomonadales bacterium]|nr:acyl carrier protein [Halioglobus sp.]MCP5129846.1 acyl carrier protein [Pseudomonadales bacterium]